MVFITGDCHQDFGKLTRYFFPQQSEMTRDDIVVICGDFGGVWDGVSTHENYVVDELNDRSFTTVFVDGNHENFDLLSQYPVCDFRGAKAHRIREHVFHILRGEIFVYDGAKFFWFGGASSHDIRDGILSRKDFNSDDDFYNAVYIWRKTRRQFRIEGVSWWAEELPSEEEMQNGLKNLECVGNSVDFVVTHCLPSSVQAVFSGGKFKTDVITDYFEELIKKIQFGSWYCGHYHVNQRVFDKYTILYRDIVRVM